MPTTLPFADAWGLILIGCFVSLILLGIIIAQAFAYFSRFPNDAKWQKIFVFVLVILDVFSSVLVMAWMYKLLIENWGNLEAFVTSDWLLASDPVVAGMIAFMAQMFFVWRIHIIAKQKFLTAFIGVCAVVTLCGGIGTGIAVLWVSEFARFGEFQQIAVIWLISAVVGDLSITASMTYYLRRRKGSFEHTDRLLDQIVALTVQNGLLTSMVALVDIVLYLSSPKPYHIAFSFLMPKLYSNTVLASLNARNSLRRDFMGTTGIQISGDSGGARSTNMRPTDIVKFAGETTTRPEVFVDVEVHEMSDPVKSHPEW